MDLPFKKGRVNKKNLPLSKVKKGTQLYIIKTFKKLIKSFLKKHILKIKKQLNRKKILKNMLPKLI